MGTVVHRLIDFRGSSLLSRSSSRPSTTRKPPWTRLRLVFSFKVKFAFAKKNQTCDIGVAAFWHILPRINTVNLFRTSRSKINFNDESSGQAPVGMDAAFTVYTTALSHSICSSCSSVFVTAIHRMSIGIRWCNCSIRSLLREWTAITCAWSLRWGDGGVKL